MSDVSAQHTDRDEVSDAELLAKHVAGDASAFEPLARRVAPVAWSYLTRLGVPADQRDDLLQEVLLRIHRGAASFDPARPMRPWVVTITAHAARDAFRRDARRLRVDESADASEAPAAPARVIALETAAFLETELERLPREQREAVLLCCVQQLAVADAAAILAVPEGTVKTWLHRGRGALAAALTRRRATERRETQR